MEKSRIEKLSLGLCSPFSWYADPWLPVASLTETEELEDDSLGSSGEDPHAVLQLLVPPLEQAVQGPQVLYSRHIQEIVLGQPCIKCLEFICGDRRDAEKK